MKELRFIARYFKRYAWKYVLGIVALYAVDALNVYIPQYTGEITDGLQNHTMDMSGVWSVALQIISGLSIFSLSKSLRNISV